MKDIFAFRVIVWHRDDMRGVHQRTIATGATPAQALKEFGEYLQRPVQYRSFTAKNRIQLHGPDGLMCELPQVEEVLA